MEEHLHNYQEQCSCEGHSSCEKDNNESGCCCGEEREESLSLTIVKLTAAILLTVAASILPLSGYITVPLFLCAYLIAGFDTIKNAFRGIGSRDFLDENFLMVIATAGAFAIREYTEAVAVMIFYGVGELFQSMAVRRSRSSIASLMDIRPDSATVRRNGELLTVHPSDILKGELILVKPGEKIPLDGKVLKGNSSLDTAALTGESIPRDVAAGDDVLSGSVNKSGILELEVTAEYAQSTVAKVLALIESSGEKKAKSEQFITKFAKIYTPVVVGIAFLLSVLPPLFLGFDSFSHWLYIGLTFLIVSCPCALVISIPISFFGGIGGASRQGVLVKGGNYLEALNSADTVVFDKTGTITKGRFSVTKLLPADGVTSDELLEAAALAESGSRHPVALSVVKAYGKEPDPSLLKEFHEEAGFGVTCETENGTLLAGKYEFLVEKGIAVKKHEGGGITVYVALGVGYLGAVLLSDEIKESSKRAVEQLKACGKKVVMLTGDNEENASTVARTVGIDHVFAGLLPGDKVERLEALMEEGKKTVFVGDGINDAPVLARADIGVAMGGIGSDAAIEAADIVLMTDEPDKLNTAFKVAAKTRQIVLQNIIFALSVKAAVLLLSVFGIASMWFAVFADVGVALIAVLNALRAMKKVS